MNILDRKSHPRGRLTLEPSRSVILAWRFREVQTTYGELIAGGGRSEFCRLRSGFEVIPAINTTAEP